MSASSAVAYRSRQPLAALADPVGAAAALAADPRRDARSSTSRCSTPNRIVFRATSSGRRSINNSLPLVFVAVGQTVVVLTRGLDLSVGGVIALSNTIVASHMHAGTGKHARLEPDRARDRRRRRARSTACWSPTDGCSRSSSRWRRSRSTTGSRSRSCRSRAARSRSSYTKHAHEPAGAVGPRLRRRRDRDLARLPPHVVRSQRLRARQRRGGGARARRSDPADEGRRLRLLRGRSRRQAGCSSWRRRLAGDATSGDAFILTSIAAVVLGGISFFGGRGSADRRHRRRLRPHGGRERPLLRAHQPALPGRVPGPVPRAWRSSSAPSSAGSWAWPSMSAQPETRSRRLRELPAFLTPDRLRVIFAFVRGGARLRRRRHPPSRLRERRRA